MTILCNFRSLKAKQDNRNMIFCHICISAVSRRSFTHLHLLQTPSPSYKIINGAIKYIFDYKRIVDCVFFHAWIQNVFMQTKHLCVLIHIWTKGEVGAPLNQFKPSSKIFLLVVPRRCSFFGSFMLFLSCFVKPPCMSVCWCLEVTFWERAALLALLWCQIVTL